MLSVPFKTLFSTHAEAAPCLPSHYLSQTCILGQSHLYSVALTHHSPPFLPFFHIHFFTFDPIYLIYVSAPFSYSFSLSFLVTFFLFSLFNNLIHFSADPYFSRLFCSKSPSIQHPATFSFFSLSWLLSATSLWYPLVQSESPSFLFLNLFSHLLSLEQSQARSSVTLNLSSELVCNETPVCTCCVPLSWMLVSQKQSHFWPKLLLWFLVQHAATVQQQSRASCCFFPWFCVG